MDSIELIIEAREKDLGGFHVRRVLPFVHHRMVGPFLFFDHMGPAVFGAGQGMDVRPHPHVNLATVTYLFEGKIEHRDNLGSDQMIEPGAINWMTAGRGIVHSERTPADLRRSGSRLGGIQCWVALPLEHEETEPSFHHHPADTLPEFDLQGARMRLLLGQACGKQSPVKVHSDLFYAEVKIPKGQKIQLPAQGREAALYVVEGRVRIDEKAVEKYTMAVARTGQDFDLEALEDSRLMWLGGHTVGPRFIFWNFVSSSMEKIRAAKRDWQAGPGGPGARFTRIPGDDREFIPLPDEP